MAPLAAQPRQVRIEGLEEAELRGLAVGACGARGQVQRHHRQVPHLRLQVAALAVELVRAEAAHDSLRLVAAVERHPGVALVLGVTEEAVVAGQRTSCSASWCSWVLVSCRQMKSACCRRSQRNSPLAAAERMPQTLTVMTRIWQ